MDKDIEEIANILINSKQAVALTGSGISTGAGIPTFRGTNGLWSKYDPDKFTIDYFKNNPKDFWKTAKELFLPLLEAKPAPSHFYLAELEKKGILKAVITQNIDGLHQKAGSKIVLELHGNGSKLKCPLCGTEYDMNDYLEDIRSDIVPKCKKCNSYLKTSAVLFGELLPRDVYMKALYFSYAADVMLVIGTSLSVEPAASLPFNALERGAKIIVINKDESPIDHLSSYVLRGESDMILKDILEAINSKL